MQICVNKIRQSNKQSASELRLILCNNEWISFKSKLHWFLKKKKKNRPHIFPLFSKQWSKHQLISKGHFSFFKSTKEPKKDFKNIIR